MTFYQSLRARFSVWAEAFAKAICEHPKASLGLGFLFMLICTPGVVFLESDFTHKVWFKKTDPVLQKYEKFEERFGNDDSIVVVLQSPGGLFRPGPMEVLRQVTEELWQLGEIIRVESLANYQISRSSEDSIEIEPLLPNKEDAPKLSQELLDQKRQTALSNEVLPGYLISEDGKTARIFGYFKPGFEKQLHHGKVYQDVLKIAEKYRSENLIFHVTGIAAYQGGTEVLVINDVSTLAPTLVLVVALIIFYIFKSLFSAFVALLTLLATLAATFGIAGWCGMSVDPLTSSLPEVLVAISIADAIHIISSFFVISQGVKERKRSIFAVIQHNLPPTLFTSLTTALGFFSLGFADLEPIQSLGLLAGIGALAAWVFTYLLATPLLLLAPEKWVQSSLESAKYVKPGSLGRSYTDFVARHARTIVIIFSLVSLAGIFLCVQNHVDGELDRYFKPTHPLTLASKFSEKHIGGHSVIEVLVDSGETDGIKRPEFLKKMETFSSSLHDLNGVTKVVSALDLLKDVNRALNGGGDAAYVLPESREKVANALFLYSLSMPPGKELSNWISEDFRFFRISAWYPSTVGRAKPIMDRVEEIAQLYHLDIEISGKAALTAHLPSLIVSTFLKSLSISIAVIFLFMTAIFGSLRLGLLSMVPNVLPLALGGGFMYLVGFPLDVGTAVVSSVALGIAVDDTIHFFLSYLRHRRDGMLARDAIEAVLQHTGKPLMFTTIILGVGFLSLSFGDFNPTIEFGVTTSFVLIVALVVDFLFVPAMLLLADDSQKNRIS